MVGASVWLGIVGGLILLRPGLVGRPDLVLPIAGLTAVVAASYGLGIVLGRPRNLGWICLIAVGAAGVWLRAILQDSGPSSDVLTVTAAAIERWLSGSSPYGIGYAASDPPGAPFPFGPIALLWYAIGGAQPQAIEMITAIAIIVLLVIRARPVGAAVYALSPLIAGIAADGSNDTSVGFLVLLGVGILGWRPLVGGVFLGLAAAFKLLAAAWIVPAAAAFGTSVLVGSVIAFVGIWAPSVIAWGPDAVATSLRRAIEIHPKAAYSLPALFEAVTSTQVSRLPTETMRLVGAAIASLAMAALVRMRRLDVAMAGSMILVVVVALGYWGSPAYLVIGAPIVCWRLDQWLGTSRWAPRLPASQAWRVASGVRRVVPVPAAAQPTTASGSGSGGRGDSG